MRASGLAEALSVESWRRLVQLAARTAQAPTAMVTVVEADRQVLVSRAGEGAHLPRSTPIEYSLCRFVVERDAPLIVGNATTDPDLRGEPAVLERVVAAYAGFPVRAPGGHVIGALCVLDTQPRTWEYSVVTALSQLAAAAQQEVTMRLQRYVRRGGSPEGERAWETEGFVLVLSHPSGTFTTRSLPTVSRRTLEDGEATA